MSPSTSYSPLPVPDRNLAHPSVRDDVRRTLYRHSFTPSTTRFSSVRDIYNLFLSDTCQQDTPALEERFRSALGRVLRPPADAGGYAASFAVRNLKRVNGMISIVSPSVRQVDPILELRQMKSEKGRRRREWARESEQVAELRKVRKEKVREEEVVVPQRVSFRYVDEFVGLNCAEDLMRLKIFPNGKELAESMSAYAAVRQFLHVHGKNHEEKDGILSFRDPNVLLVAVGDGCTPRTACLFAFRSAWRCVSIDPMMREDGLWNTVSNLETIPAKVQDATVKVRNEERVVVVMWHCHAGIDDALGCLEFEGTKWDVGNREASGELRRRVAVVSCACCNYDQVQKVMPDGREADVEFEDIAVPGLMRTVRVWKFLRGEARNENGDGEAV